jgi:benzoyl-CoA 2,3-dioxygenase component B
VPLRNAMNEVLRDAYIEDCQRGVDRWNKRLAEAGLDARLALPRSASTGTSGSTLACPSTPRASSSTRRSGTGAAANGCPSDADRAYVANLQKAVRDPAQIANWIAKPARASRACPSSTNTCVWRTDR